MCLSALIAHDLWIAVGIKVLGGSYLVYLGVQLWYGSFATTKHHNTQAPTKPKNAYWAGVFTCLTNPKAIAFFASLFSVVLTPSTSVGLEIWIAVGVPILALLWFSCVALCFSKIAVRLRYQRSKPLIDRVVGTVLGVLGVKLILATKT